MRPVVLRGLMALALAGTWASTASAQTCVDRAHGELANAELGAARAALEECAGASGFTLADLAAYHEAWALVHFGEGQQEEGDRALARLAAIAPEHQLRPEVPPRIRARFETLVAAAVRPRLELTAEREGGEVVIEAHVRDDPHGVVVQARVHARDAASGDFGPPAQDRVSVQSEGDVAYYGVAEGVGGAQVATAGSSEAPLWLRSEPRAAQGDDLPLVLGVTAAVVVVVAVVVGVAVGVGTQQGGTTVGAPTPQGFIHF